MADHDNEDEVGYGKPPKRTRFKTGQSGNPNGRPLGTKNVASIVNEACLRKVTVKGEDGRQYKMSKIEAIMTQLINAAAKGDFKATRTCFAIFKMFPVIMDIPSLQPPQVIVNFVDAKDGKAIPDYPNGQ